MCGVSGKAFLSLIVAVFLPPAAGSAQSLLPPASVVQTPAAALAQDSAEYARQFGVPMAEAARRLIVQEASVAATDRIAEVYRDRLAGIWIEHLPRYRIVVSLTGAAPLPPQHIVVDGRTVPIAFRTGAKATRDRIIRAMTYHQAAIRALFPSPPAIGLDPKTGELVVVVGTIAASEGIDAIRARIEAITGVAVQIRVFDRVDMNLGVEGGSRVAGISPVDGRRYVCTTGFAVGDGVRSGITTAAHCLDTLTYYDPRRGALPLEYVGQWGWGYRDVQINLSAEAPVPFFYADTAKTVQRPVTAQRSRTSTRAGDFVCHRGERTGYSCALVELTDFAPAGDLCGGACLATWVTVAGPTCKGGDSGSPVFSGTTAFGILKGGSYRRDGSCAFYFYMSLDYLPPGWALIHDTGAATSVSGPAGR